MLFSRSLHVLWIVFFAGTLMSSCANIERVRHAKSGQEINQQPSDLFPYRSESNAESKKAKSIESAQSSINPGVQALLQQAQSQQAEGKTEAAVSTVERALRISPQTPQLHLLLAELRLKQDQAHNALQLALKGQSLLFSNDLSSSDLSSSDRELVKSFWQIIGDCYTRLGITSKASQAYSHLQ
jgi:tetratricopeptide (TPR) repeat protein